MSKKKVWFITGVGRGMGLDFAKAALAAGHAVVATGRDKGVSSTAGLVGFEFGSAYAASKFGLEGWMASSFGRARTASSQATRPSSRERSSPSRARTRRHAASSGADAVATAQQVVADLKAQTEAYRDLSTALALKLSPPNGRQDRHPSDGLRNRQEIDKSGIRRVECLAKSLSELVELTGIEPVTS